MSYTNRKKGLGTRSHRRANTKTPKAQLAARRKYREQIDRRADKTRAA